MLSFIFAFAWFLIFIISLNSITFLLFSIFLPFLYYILLQVLIYSYYLHLLYSIPLALNSFYLNIYMAYMTFCSTSLFAFVIRPQFHLQLFSYGIHLIHIHSLLSILILSLFNSLHLLFVFSRKYTIHITKLPSFYIIFMRRIILILYYEGRFFYYKAKAFGTTGIAGSIFTTE